MGAKAFQLVIGVGGGLLQDLARVVVGQPRQRRFDAGKDLRIGLRPGRRLPSIGVFRGEVRVASERFGDDERQRSRGQI